MENNFARNFNDRSYEIINAPYWFEALDKEYPNGIECDDTDLVGTIPVITKDIIIKSKYKDEEWDEYIPDVIYSKKITLEITSYIGTCGEAVHYYGYLKSYSPFSTNIIGWAYPCIDGVHISLTRLIERRDVIYNNGDWMKYEYIGVEYTHGFWSEEDVISRAKEIFEKHFGNDWNLEIKSCV
jgi:hypothetical protein